MNTTKQIITSASPIYLSSLFATAYNVINVIIVAKHLSKDAVAAIGIASTVMFLLQGLTLGLCSGFLSKISKDKRMASHSLVITLIFSAVFTALTLLFLPKILTFLKAKGEIFTLAKKYLLVSVAGFFALSLYRLFESWLYSVGKSKAVIALGALMAVLQSGLTFLFVAVFDFKIIGAAVAGAASFFVCGLAAFIYFLKTEPSFVKIQKRVEFSLLKDSLPIALMQFFKGAGLVAVQMAVGKLGADAMAAFAVCQKISHVATDGATALNSASIRVFSVKKQAKTKSAVTVAVVFSAAVGIILLLCAPPLSRFIFNKDGEVLALIKRYFYIITPFFSMLCSAVILRARLIANSHPYLAMTEGIVEFAVRAVLVFFAKDFLMIPTVFGISWTAGLLYLVAVKKDRIT